MSTVTPATRFLQQRHIPYSIHTYTYDPQAEQRGLQAAQALEQDPLRVYKTLMILLDGKPVCVVIPSSKQLSMKKVATFLGGKSANMMDSTQAERLTGYHVGGISPFGQRKKVATIFAAEAMKEENLYINGGRRGLLVQLSSADAITVLTAYLADITQ